MKRNGLFLVAIGALIGVVLMASVPAGASTADQIRHLKRRVARLEDNFTTLQGQVSTLQGQVSTLQGQVSTLQGQVSTLQGDLVAVQDRTQNLGADGVLPAAYVYEGLTCGLDNSFSADYHAYWTSEGRLTCRYYKGG